MACSGNYNPPIGTCVGALDESRFYDLILTQQEMTALANE
jgi:hypothetical protein